MLAFWKGVIRPSADLVPPPGARAVPSDTELHVSLRFKPALHGSLCPVWIIPPSPLDVWLGNEAPCTPGVLMAKQEGHLRT